ncbi:alpha-2,8-sialyltransferase 8B-like [Branchiostoma lanceolatum]|uniref:alpha-2,8-sialyltransferase 8B-like n=1 Tax=Branchiostoma lanceolatum TaxID=7740 RepID=UPI00345470A8
MLSRHFTRLWQETTFHLNIKRRRILAITILFMIIAFMWVKSSGYQVYTKTRDIDPLASAPRLVAVNKPWAQNKAEFLKLKDVLRSSLRQMIAIVQVSKDVNLIRRCHETHQCQGVSPLRHYGTCALVGSSGILLNSRCGDEIDASDFVIRFNLSPQSGYTKDVGEKSSMMVLNTVMSGWVEGSINGAGVARPRKDSKIETANNTILFIPKSRSTTYYLQHSRSLEQTLRKQGINVIVAMGVPTAELTRDERRRQIWEVLDKDHNDEDMPSTGLLLVEIAITLCDRVRLYGFYPFARDQQNHVVPYHYWDNFTSVESVLQKRKHPHNFAYEFELLRNLHNKGVIEHKIGPCNNNL